MTLRPPARRTRMGRRRNCDPDGNPIRHGATHGALPGLPHSCQLNIFCETRSARARMKTAILPELAAVKTQQPITSDQEHRVLKFRPRTTAHPPGPRGEPAGRIQPEGGRPPADQSALAPDREQPDEFRHRMLANLAAFAFTVALTAIGIWLAMSIADLRNTQDCVLMGRRDCAHIPAPPS